MVARRISLDLEDSLMLVVFVAMFKILNVKSCFDIVLDGRLIWGGYLICIPLLVPFSARGIIVEIKGLCVRSNVRAGRYFFRSLVKKIP